MKKLQNGAIIQVGPIFSPLLMRRTNLGPRAAL